MLWTGPLLATIFLAGCGTYEWQHNSKTAPQADAQLLKCEAQSLKLYPNLVTQDVSGGRSKGANSGCVAVQGSKTGALKCETKGGKSYGASTYSRDINRSDRERATKRCMRAMGWRRVKIE